jgi:hypothetical protein
MTGIAKFAVLLALALAVAAAPARADKQVIFAPLSDGPDFDEAMRFFSSYLDPRDYDTARRLEGTGGSWKLGNTLDLYLREFVKLGKGDVDDDGIDERFYILEDPGWCGSGGCLTLVVQKRPDGWKILCESAGVDNSTWISDWVSTSGLRELETMHRVYWHGDKCYSANPELLEEFRHKPELYPRPPIERIWKPIQ